MGARFLHSSNRFTPYRSYPIEPKVGRMIQDVRPHNRFESDFPIPPVGAVGARLLKSSNR